MITQKDIKAMSENELAALAAEDPGIATFKDWICAEAKADGANAG